MKFVVPIFTLTTMLLLASMFGTVNAVEVHKNGFGGITPFNNTGLTVFNDSLKRSFDYESDSLILSAEFSILETNGDIRDFSLFDNDLTRQNTTPSPTPRFVDSTFRTALETIVYEDNATFSPTNDTYIREDTPDGNYGTQTVMNVASWSSGSFNRRSLVEYNISSIPAGAIVTFAEIVWATQTGSGSLFPRNYDAQRITSSWDESTVTWNTQPSIGGTIYTTSVTTTSNPDSWTITAMVQGWHDGSFTNYGVRVRDDTENAASLNHKQYYTTDFGAGAPDPVLEVTWASGQWAEASHSESLDMENTNVSLVWWGQIKQSGVFQFITGKGCSGYSYGLILDNENQIGAEIRNSTCDGQNILTDLPSNGLSLNQTYGIGVVFEDNPLGANVHFWLDGEWIYNETANIRIGDNDSDFYIGRPQGSEPQNFCDCTHDEVLVFKERLSNDTMKLLTTKQHDIVIKSGPGVTPQGFAGLFFALPWLIVFGLLGWLFYIIAMAWREPFTGE